MKFPTFYFGKRLFRACLPLALFLILFSLVDYGISGPIRVKDVRFLDGTSNNALILSLPSHGHYNKGVSYYYALNVPHSSLDYVFPLQIVSDVCMTRVKINGRPFATDTFMRNNLCSMEPITVSPSDHVEVAVRNTSGENAGLQIVRRSFLSKAQRIIILIAAVYLLSLSYAENWQGFRHIHYIWLVTAVFIFSFWPHNHDYPNEWWINFMANGLAIAFLAFIGIFWSPTNRLYLAIERLQQKMLHIPPRIFVTFCVVAFFLLAACLSQWLFDGLPHVADTHVQYMQSKIFAEGKMYEQSHPLSRFFDFQNAINDGKYYSGTFPGHAMLLAVGQLLGVPWLVNPLMGALSVWAIFLLANELGGRAAGYVAALLTLVSPMVVFMASGYMNHASCMFFLTLFLYAYIRLCKTGNWVYAALAGCSVGAAFLIRVQSTVPFALPVAVHALWRVISSPKKNFSNALIMLEFFSFFAAFLLYYQYTTTGSPWITGYNKFNPYAAESYKQFLTRDGWEHFQAALATGMAELQQKHKQLFEWPTSPLWLVFCLFIAKSRPAYSGLVLATVLGQFLGIIFLLPNAGGPYVMAYMHECSSSLIVLIALGIQQIVLAVHKSELLKPYARPAIASICVGVLCCVAISVPYRVVDLYRIYANNYWEGDWGYYYMLSHSIETPALVFISPYEAYRLVYFTQPPRDENPIIFAQNRHTENRYLMGFYPDRHVYMVHKWNVQKIR